MQSKRGNLRKSIRRGVAKPRICVVGLGYVGMQLAIAFDRADYPVTGFDIDPAKIQSLEAGQDPTNEFETTVMKEAAITYTDNPHQLSNSDFFIIAVPTPVNDSNEPELKSVEEAGRLVGENLPQEGTVVLESTVYPGATEEKLVPALESSSEMDAGVDFSVGYSPERAVPGKSAQGLQDIVKIVSARDEQTLVELEELYGDIVEAGVYPAPSIETAEAAKCLENTQRDVNIALVNEFAMACQRSAVDIDPHEVIAAARTKWNFHDYRPGLVGGHCIPVDPYFLIAAFEEHGASPKLMRTARKVNESVASHIVELTAEGLQQRDRKAVHEIDHPTSRGRPGDNTKTEQVLVAGLAYKPNTGDIRTPAIKRIIDELRQYDLNVVGFDPHSETNKTKDQFEIQIQEELSLDGFDILIVPTPHDELCALDTTQIEREMNENPIFIDVQGAFRGSGVHEGKLIYKRL